MIPSVAEPAGVGDPPEYELIDAGEGPVMPRALAALRRGRFFVTELDEIKHWRPADVKVMRLFDRRVRLDRTVELLHRRTGAPVLLALVKRLAPGRGYRLVVEQSPTHLQQLGLIKR